MKLFRVRVGGNFHFLTFANISQIGLVDVDQNPDGAGVGNGEALSGSGLQELAGSRRGVRPISPETGAITGISAVDCAGFLRRLRDLSAKRAQSVCGDSRSA